MREFMKLFENVNEENDDIEVEESADTLEEAVANIKSVGMARELLASHGLEHLTTDGSVIQCILDAYTAGYAAGFDAGDTPGI
jgi:hypothetical protein